MAESGTVYVKVTVNSKGKATKVVMTEDKFTDNTASSTYTVKGFNKDRIIVSRGGTSTTYEFGSTSDITYYIWEKALQSGVKFLSVVRNPSMMVMTIKMITPPCMPA